jgi:hypothetical protein
LIRRRPTKAELKARRSAAAAPKPQEGLRVRFTQPSGLELHRLGDELLAVPTEVRAAIADELSAHAFRSASAGGLCALRALQAQRAIKRHTGLLVPLCFGAMVYRCGPEEDRDVVAFCGRANSAQVSPMGGFLGHVWLAAGETLIDFSTADWLTEDEDELQRFNESLAEQERREHGLTFGAFRIEARPPRYVWERFLEPGGIAEPWRPAGTPSLGRAYYKPLGHMPGEYIARMYAQALRAVEAMERLSPPHISGSRVTHTYVVG